jgi:HK97 family phage major capsid protein
MQNPLVQFLLTVAVGLLLLFVAPLLAKLADEILLHAPRRMGMAGDFEAEAFKEPEVKALALAVKEALKEHGKSTRTTIEGALEEVKKLGTIEGQTADQVKAAVELGATLQKQLADLEKVVSVFEKGGNGSALAAKTIGQIVTESEQFKDAVKEGRANAGHGMRQGYMEPVLVKSFWDDSKAIVNATGQNQPLVPSDRQAGIITPQLRRMTIRDLIPVARTTSNLIEWVKELAFTNNAGPQYSATSPATYEGVNKPESNLTFQLQQSAVVTIAHWIAASRQVLSDAGYLQAYIENRLRYGLQYEEEDELLNSTGAAGELNGLINQATAFNQINSADTVLDILLRSVLQVSLSDFEASGFILNPRNWYAIQLLKDTQGRYIFGDPSIQQAPRVWGLPVVATQAMANNRFMTGAFNMAAMIFDREDATVRIAEQHADFFVRNMVAILAEERLALAVFRPTAIVYGTIPS